MLITATVRRWLARWKAWRESKHRSNWDNPLNERDLLAAMIEADRLRKARQLP